MKKKTLASHFSFREGFTTFLLEPEKDQAFLFGDKDRALRDRVLEGVEDAAIGDAGYKAVNYADYGVGKTHLSHNLIVEIKRKGLPVRPVYVRSWEYHAKEPFHRLFTEMLSALGKGKIQEAAIRYGQKIAQDDAQPWDKVVPSHMAPVFVSLASLNLEVVHTAIRWLGGALSGSSKMTDNQRTLIMAPLAEDIEVSRDFAAVMRGFVHLFAEPGCGSEHGEILLFMIDEAERLKQVTHNDTYWSWVGCLRMLTEITGVGLMFFVGAAGSDDLPDMLTWDEVSTRIGHANYHEMMNPGYDGLTAWVHEFLQTIVQKGPVPETVMEALPIEVALDESIADGVVEAVGSDPEALGAYPFTPESLESLVQGCLAADLSNRPREVIKRIQAAATRATRLEQPLITEDILEATIGEGL